MVPTRGARPGCPRHICAGALVQPQRAAPRAPQTRRRPAPRACTPPRHGGCPLDGKSHARVVFRTLRVYPRKSRREGVRYGGSRRHSQHCCCRPLRGHCAGAACRSSGAWTSRRGVRGGTDRAARCLPRSAASTLASGSHDADDLRRLPCAHRGRCPTLLETPSLLWDLCIRM